MEAMLATTRKSLGPVVKGQPEVGFNFSTMQSTGRSPVSVTGAQRSALSGANAVDGYTGALAVGTTAYPVTPTSAIGAGTGDFTLEWAFYGQGVGTGTSRFFVIGGLGQIAFLASSYAGKLGVTHPNSGYAVIRPVRADLVNGWHHLAFVRKSGILRIFLDGVEMAIALGTSTTFLTGGVDFPKDWASGGAFTINDGNYPYPMLLAEFAFHKSAIYSDNFMPTYPLVA